MAIDPEILERLLIDRALGGLPPDAEALLDDYLAGEPAAAAEAEEFARAAELARRALAPAEEADSNSLPPLSLGAGRSDIWRFGARAAALAACLLVGLGLGIWLSQTHRPASVAKPFVPQKIAQAGAATQAARESEIWSVRRFYEALARPPRTSGLRLVWDSPTKMPRVEESR